MNIKNETDPADGTLLICNECKLSLTQKFLFSHLCNHRICENCYIKTFDKVETINTCKICNKPHNHSNYKWKSREDEFCFNESKVRNAILKV